MLAYLLVLLAIISRLLPHLPNMAPITGLALFSGVYLKRSQAIWLPLAAMAISDLFLASEPISTRLTVYGSFILIGMIGIWLRNRKNVRNIILSSVAGSVVFYLVTNFAFFYPSSMYAHNFSGIISSYYYAMPFFRNTIIGDLMYTGILFGAYEFALYLARLSRSSPLEEKTN